MFLGPIDNEAFEPLCVSFIFISDFSHCFFFNGLGEGWEGASSNFSPAPSHFTPLLLSPSQKKSFLNFIEVTLKLPLFSPLSKELVDLRHRKATFRDQRRYLCESAVLGVSPPLVQSREGRPLTYLAPFSLGHRAFPWVPSGRISGLPPGLKRPYRGDE